MKTEKKEIKMCDKCGNRVHKERFELFEFQLEYRTGTHYPEGGSEDEWSLDLCQECAPKLLKILQDNGFKPRHKEWYL